MVSKPKLSLIICSRNRASKLQRCLDSISAEEMLQAKGEVILVNNGSTDNTEKVMLAHQKTALFPVSVVNEPQKGLSRARNAGITVAQGKVLAFTDDDCCLTEEYLIKASIVFDTEEFDYCGGQICENGKKESNGCSSSNAITLIKPHQFIWAGTIQGSNMLFTRKVVEKVGLFDTLLGAGTAFPCEDIDYVARACWQGFRGATVPELIVYHLHGRAQGGSSERKTHRGYDFGRGAYYMKFILAGKRSYFSNWMKTATFNRWKAFLREVVAALLYYLMRVKICVITFGRSAGAPPQ